jgi:anti-sigma factor RsiW
VADFASQGFALTGGRVDDVAGSRAAVMVYHHGNHELDLFAWPDRGAKLPQPGMRHGFRTGFWKSGDLDFAAVSDVDEAAFQKFIALAQAQRE